MYNYIDISCFQPVRVGSIALKEKMYKASELSSVFLPNANPPDQVFGALQCPNYYISANRLSSLIRMAPTGNAMSIAFGLSSYSPGVLSAELVKVSTCAWYADGSEKIAITNGTIGNDDFPDGALSVKLGPHVTEIGESFALGQPQLTHIDINDHVTSIGSAAFSGCTGLMSVTIPDSVTNIGDFAFYGCNSLESMTIPNGISTIKSDTFHDCSALVNVSIPSSVSSIEDDAFNNCMSIISVTIPNSATSIGNRAFNDCTSLTSVTIGNSMTRFGEQAFANCSSLLSVIIPDSVSVINSDAFISCNSMVSAVFENRTLDQIKEISDDNGQNMYPWGLNESVIIAVINSLAQTSDGKCKVMTFKDTADGSSTDFTLGHQWVFTGEGLFDQQHAPEGEWYGSDAFITVDGNEAGLTLEHSEDGTVCTVIENGDIPLGTYENVPLSYDVHRGSATETLTLTIPTLYVT